MPPDPIIPPSDPFGLTRSFASQAVWLHSLDPDWIEANLLSRLNGDSDSRGALWAGYLRPSTVHLGPLYQRLKPALIELAGEHANMGASGRSVAAYLTLGWTSRDPETGERAVADPELRRALILGDDEFRTQALWYVKRGEDEAGGMQEEEIFHFLRDVWPIQRVAYSSVISLRLCEVMVRLRQRFPDALEEFLHRLTFLDADPRMFFNRLGREGSDLVERHPEPVLRLIHRMLTDETRGWPFGVDTLLDRIAAAAPALASDRRLLELRQRLDGRWV